MPIRAERLDDQIRDRLPTLPTLGAVSVRMAAHAPRIPILLHEGRRPVERITTLSAKEVPGVPFRAARHDDFSFDGCLAALTPGREELMEIQMAVKTRTWITVFCF